MAKIHLDFIVLETFERLFGVTALLDALDKAIPEMEWQEREALKQMAAAEHWDYGDYDVEGQVLDAKFRQWIPRFAAYSVVTLLHSTVESQFVACAERAGKMRGSRFLVKDVRGKGIDQAALYLQRLISLEVKQDPAWEDLKNLQDLRNAVVHRGGKRGTLPDHQKTMGRLLNAYPDGLSFPDKRRNFLGEEVWISMNLCRQLVRKVEGFFRRLFEAVGLSDKNAITQ